MKETPFYIRKPQDETSAVLSDYGIYPNDNRVAINNLYTKNMERIKQPKAPKPSLSYLKDIENNGINELYAKNMERISQHKTPKTLPSSWKDNIDYSEGYNSKIEDKFRSEHDYLGLADYLSKFKMNNIMDQRAYEQEISQLRRYGRQYNAIQANATEEQRESIAFLEAFDNGNIDDLDKDNSYKKQYEEAIYSLGRKGSYLFADYYTNDYRSDDWNSPEAATITVSFNTKHVSRGLWGYGFDWMSKDTDENQYELFSKDTGYSPGEIRNILGDNAITTKEGRIIINIPKSNIEGIKFLSAVRNWCNNTGRTTDDVSYASYDTNKNLITDDTIYIGSRIQDISNIIEKVNNDKNSIKDAIGGGEQIMSTTILPYMNEKQMQLMNMRNRGLIDANKVQNEIELDNKIYENLLLGVSFTKYDIYTDKNNEIEGDETLNPLTDNLAKGKLKDYVRNAIRDNRVTFNAGISGGEYGTYLKIAPKDDDGTIITDNDDSRKGSVIFIPGLFTKSVQKAFDSSTQGKTVAEINSMQQYGYQYTLNNGNILSNIGNDTARLYDANTDSYRNITREEAHDLLHESIIIEDATINIRNRMFNLDGTVRQGYDYDQDIKKIALAAANELYEGQSITSDDVWVTSKEKQKENEAKGNLYYDYKRNRALDIYEQLKNNIYKLLNVNK